jgi:hypothetical protein
VTLSHYTRAMRGSEDALEALDRAYGRGAGRGMRENERGSRACACVWFAFDRPKIGDEACYECGCF